jgi:hypothetical protein
MLKGIQLRIAQLDSLVAQLEALTGPPKPESGQLFETPKPSLPPVVVSPAKEVPQAQIPLWKAIVNSLNGKKGDFTVPEAIAALERTGRHIESPNRTQIVRNTLIQNKNFGRLEVPGHYYVVGFEDTGVTTQALMVVGMPTTASEELRY